MGKIDFLRVRAPSKINLSLHITGRRPDGYHLLESVVVFAVSECASDTILLSCAANTSFSVEGYFAKTIPNNKDNIILRAIEALERKFPDGDIAAHIRLVKNLPPASGLGGGSADAAAVLRALSLMYMIEERDIVFLAKALGADVPVCLMPRASMITGIGECIKPFSKIPAMWIVLINPKIPLSTKTIFDAFYTGGDMGIPHPPIFTDSLDTVEDFTTWLIDYSRNDLQPHSISTVPIIKDIIDMTASTEGCLLARMSGSGATCFGIYTSEDKARNAAQCIADSCNAPLWMAVTSVS